jgi:hypothetical protein
VPHGMFHVLSHRYTYFALRMAGLAVGATYLVLIRDFAFSVVWASGYVLISFVVAAVLVKSKLGERWPWLHSYHFAKPRTYSSDRERYTNETWAVEKAAYLERGLRGWQILFAVAEDGLICIPVLLIGITPASCLLGGMVFGVIHVGRFTYLECSGKAIIYSLACLLVLPHGFLTVAAGHLSTDLLGLMSLRMVKRHAGVTRE